MGGDPVFEPSQKRTKEAAEQFPQVGPGASQHGVVRIAGQALQEAPAHAVVAFQVPDVRTVAVGKRRLQAEPVDLVGNCTRSWPGLRI